MPIHTSAMQPSDYNIGLSIDQQNLDEIDETTSGQNELVAAQGTNTEIWVTKIVFIVDGASTVKFQSGNNDLTGDMSFGADGGLALDLDKNPIRTNANEALNINIGSAVNTDGFIIWYAVNTMTERQ